MSITLKAISREEAQNLDRTAQTAFQLPGLIQMEVWEIYYHQLAASATARWLREILLAEGEYREFGVSLTTPLF